MSRTEKKSQMKGRNNFRISDRIGTVGGYTKMAATRQVISCEFEISSFRMGYLNSFARLQTTGCAGAKLAFSHIIDDYKHPFKVSQKRFNFNWVQSESNKWKWADLPICYLRCKVKVTCLRNILTLFGIRMHSVQNDSLMKADWSGRLLPTCRHGWFCAVCRVTNISWPRWEPSMSVRSFINWVVPRRSVHDNHGTIRNQE